MTNNTPETFSDIKNLNLKTWNRCAQIFNLAADKGMQVVRDYVAQFNEQDRDLIGRMFARIKTEGYEKTRSSINREVQANGS